MGLSFDKLNNYQIDVLKEIGNIGAGNATTALAKMLRRKVDMDVPKVKVLKFQEVSEILGGADIPVVGLLLRVTGDIEGSIMFILGKVAPLHLSLKIYLKNLMIQEPWIYSQPIIGRLSQRIVRD